MPPLSSSNRPVFITFEERMEMKNAEHYAAMVASGFRDYGERFALTAFSNLKLAAQWDGFRPPCGTYLLSPPQQVAYPACRHALRLERPVDFAGEHRYRFFVPAGSPETHFRMDQNPVRLNMPSLVASVHAKGLISSRILGDMRYCAEAIGADWDGTTNLYAPFFRMFEPELCGDAAGGFRARVGVQGGSSPISNS